MHTCKRGNVFPKTNQLYWTTKRSGNVERDRLNRIEYKKAGWKTLVVWECETKNIEKLAYKLNRFLNS